MGRRGTLIAATVLLAAVLVSSVATGHVGEVVSNPLQWLAVAVIAGALLAGFRSPRRPPATPPANRRAAELHEQRSR